MSREFDVAGIPFADEDALDLLLGMSGLSQSDYVMRGMDDVPSELAERLRHAVARRLAGEPVDRILGWRDFYGRRFAIDNVLSPRGDSEVLLIAALNAVQQSSGTASPNGLELGAGSGALSITLLCECDRLTMTATDISEAAVRISARNAQTHGVADRLTVRQADWLEDSPEAAFDIVLSNPPYITRSAMATLSRDVADFDPPLALDGGPDGLDAYRRIIPNAPRVLASEGWLGVEIGYDQGTAVSDLFRQSGFEDVHTLTDPAGHDRVVHGRWRC